MSGWRIRFSLLATLALLLPARAAGAGQEILVPYRAAGYRYLVVPFDGGAGFESPAFDDSAFGVGSAPFGSLSALCTPSGTVRTIWRENSDLLLRKTFAVPAWARGISVAVAIDNDVQVFLNGVEISQGLRKSEGCAVADRFLFQAPAGVVIPGGINVLAVRARDRGVIDYCDLEVRGSVAGPAPAGSTTFLLHSGREEPGSPDLSLWVQGSEIAGLSAVSSELPLQHPFVLDTPPAWGEVDGARWVSPSPTASASPGGYEYYALFAVPPGIGAARLDLIWRAGGASELAINGTRVSDRGGSPDAAQPPGEFHGEITALLTPGLNRLQFFVANARPDAGPTGLDFCGQVTLSP